MKEHLTPIAKDWMIWFLAGIGVSFPPHHYVGGLFLAMAGAAVAARMQPEQDGRELWLVLLSAWLIATVASAIVFAYRPEMPPQIVMASAGFLSRYVARAALAFAGKVEASTDTIFDRMLARFLPRKGGDQ